MPTKKRSTPPATETKPGATDTFIARFDASQADLKHRATIITEFADIDANELEVMETARLIHRRDRGYGTPIESFIYQLLTIYRVRDWEGLAPTLAQIEGEMETLRRDYTECLEQATFVASRYKAPEATEA